MQSGDACYNGKTGQCGNQNIQAPGIDMKS
jgi:hypothetical protein